MCQYRYSSGVRPCFSTAVKNKTLPEDMPSKLYIISDMEFDYCAENSDVTNFEYAKEKFEQNGYAFA